MQVDVSILIALIGCALGIAGFFVGRAAANKKEGEEAGEMRSDVKHIREKVDKVDQRVERFDTRLKNEVNRLSGRIDEQGLQLMQVTQIATKALASSKSSHKRQDDHLRRDHDQLIKPHYDDDETEDK